MFCSCAFTESACVFNDNTVVSVTAFSSKTSAKLKTVRIFGEKKLKTYHVNLVSLKE